MAGLLYLPWLPTLLYQTAHTGAPWLNSPRLGAPVQISKSLLGGGTVTVALVLAAGSGLAAVYTRRTTSKEREAMIVALTIGVATLAVAWLFSQVSPAWTTRYLGVALGPIFLLASLGLARAGNLGLVALVIVLGIWAIPRTAGLENKSNAADLAAAVSDKMRPGDLVVTLQPEQHPLIHYHLRNDMIEATELGEVQRKGVMDWRDVQDKLEAATPAENLAPLLARVPRRGTRAARAPRHLEHRRLGRARGRSWSGADRLSGARPSSSTSASQREGAVPTFYRRARRIGVRGVLYTKTSEQKR